MMSTPEVVLPLSAFIEHGMCASEVACPDHVGIGLDCGDDAPKPVDLKDCSTFGDITCELLKRGVPDSTIRKVWGENARQLMSEVERVSTSLRTGS